MQGKGITKAGVSISFQKSTKNKIHDIILITSNLFLNHNSQKYPGYNYVTYFLQFGYTMKHGCTCALLETKYFY